MCKDYTAVISRTVTAANNVKHLRHRYWLLRYLEERKGQLIDALVIDSGPKRVSMILVDLLMDVDLATQPGVRPAPDTIVKLRIAKSDPLDNSVRFEWP